VNSGTTYETLRPAGGADRQAVLDVLTEAFADDPVTCWLFPREEERCHLQSHYYGLLLAHPAAEAYLVGGHAGASIWQVLAEGQSPYEEPKGRTDQRTVFGESGARLQVLGSALTDRHPHGETHLYLPCMGVTAAARGGGLGSAMLRDRLNRADADGLGAYLEAGSLSSRALYQRHGFTDLGEPVRVQDSPPLWPMWRAPRRSTKENGATR
jgi:ribosomal protein S18 acetylase RimI-like enzyme